MTKKSKRRKWDVNYVKLVKFEQDEKEYKKMVEVMADIFYHHIRQLYKDQKLTQNSLNS